MNEREGGVAERFSFPQHEDFLDFLIEMAFDQNRAREVREQLTTFRHELVERNEQLKPELEYCRGMVVRLERMVGVERDRSVAYGDIETARRLLTVLSNSVFESLLALNSDQRRLESAIRESQASADAARSDADLSNRMAAVYRRQASRLRLTSIEQEYIAAEEAYIRAKRLKSIWSAARLLARVWEARRRATQLRDQLARKLQEFAPELAELSEIATRFANALEFEAVTLRSNEAQQRAAEATLKQSAAAAQESAGTFGEKAATAEAEVKRLRELLERAHSEMEHLRRSRVLLENEVSADEAAQRISKEIESLETRIREQGARIGSQTSVKTELITRGGDLVRSLRRLEGERAELETLWKRANDRRVELETDAALLRLLQTDKIDVQSAAARAVEVANEELRRTTETILRIRVEAAEDIRAIHWLEGDAALLPPSKDVDRLIQWLRNQRIVCWSGWEYIERNGGPSPADRRKIVQRLPHVATGIVVADSQYDSTVEALSRHSQIENLRLMAPVAIVPAAAFSAEGEMIWTVVGPSSD